jgi:hypothetical protein
MKEGLERYLDGGGEEMGPSANGEAHKVIEKTRKTKAMFIGTRRTDPHGGTSILQGWGRWFRCI